ncbi:MAG: hypothetical protein ABIP82_00230 [Nitrospirales bacterium]
MIAWLAERVWCSGLTGSVRLIRPSRASGQPATHDKESHGHDHGKYCQDVQVRYAHAHVSGVVDPDVGEY